MRAQNILLYLLNLIENIGLFTKDVKRSNLLFTYQSICLDDYIQYKYIQNNIDMQLLIYLFLCVTLNIFKTNTSNIN